MKTGSGNTCDPLFTHDVLRLIGADHVLIDVHPHAFMSVGIIGEVLSLARYLGHPPESKAATRTRNAAFSDELVERARNLENTARSARIVVCALHSFLHVSSQHYVLCSRIRAPDVAFYHDLPRFISLSGGESRIHLRANPNRTRRSQQPVVKLHALSRRQHECEGWFCVADLSRWHRQPPHLIGHVEPRSVGSRAFVEGARIPHNSRRSLSDDDILHDRRYCA